MTSQFLADSPVALVWAYRYYLRNQLLEVNKVTLFRERSWLVLCTLILSTLAFGALLGCAPAEDDAPEKPEETTEEPPLPDKDAWYVAMLDTPKPGPGCWKAEHPNMEWMEVECTERPPEPFLPKGHPEAEEPAPEEVGDGTDYSAQVSGSLSSVSGSFVNLDNVTSEYNSGSNTPNEFSLQLNTSFWTGSPACSGDNCQAWQQFVYSSNGSGGGAIFIQYWLINYSGSCPSGWSASGGSCFTNSSQHSVPAQTIASLGNITLTGSATANGNDDFSLNVDGTIYSVQPPDSKLDLAGNWTIAEFNIFGNGNGSSAVFNDGASMTVNLTVRDGTTSAPSCVVKGYTGETNNLNLVATPAISTQTYPTVQFNQSTSTGSSSCATAAGTNP